MERIFYCFVNQLNLIYCNLPFINSISYQVNFLFLKTYQILNQSFSLFKQFSIFILPLQIFLLFEMNFLVKSLYKSISYSIKSPLDLSLFKSQNSIALVKKSLNARFRNPNIADDISTKLKTYRQQLHHLQMLNKKANTLKTQIKSLMTTKNQNKPKDQIQTMKEQMSNVKNQQKNKETLIKQLIMSLEKDLLKVGNIVHEEVPISKDETNNKCINKFYPYGKVGQKQTPLNHFNKKPQSYQKLNQLFEISDLKRGQKVSGHRGYFLKHNGLKLALALTNYGLQFLQSQGYNLYQTPMIIFENVLKENCQLQTVQNDMYKLQGQSSYLIATSQQALAAYYKGEVLEPKQLPIKMGGYSSCFRKQAGAHGKDIHGLFRVHQFQKIEQFVICHPEQSNSQMKRMLQVSQKFYQSLKIPYQVVDIVSGQLNDAAIRKFDLEGWYPSQNKYRELVSISNCTDYQSRLTEVTFRNGSQTQNVHMLNGTLTAVERTLTCIMENYYDSERGVLKIPEKLQKYFGKEEIKLDN